MSTEQKKREQIERELIKLGIENKEELEILVDEIDSLAKVIIIFYQQTNENNQLSKRGGKNA
jgi:hypothetical protein